MRRRPFLKSALGLGLASAHPALLATAETETVPIRKAIPASGEMLSVVGMGTSRTFTRPDDQEFQNQLLQVLRLFFAGGGQLLDSSPMYGPAETILGRLLGRIEDRSALFAATKVWTTGEQQGIDQMHDSMRKMGVARMDLMQIHNLKDWRVHLKTLRAWKEQGKIRYIGITTSHGRFHDELLAIMQGEPLDFVQFSYNLVEREAEQRLLPMAADKGIATLINRPYKRGDLFARSRNQPLPEALTELGCASWGQAYLKWILGHPAVNCVIPASSKPKHIADNMGAGFGHLPNAQEREQIRKEFAAL